MSPLFIALIVFACAFGSALGGMVLHIKVPDRHLDADSRDVVKLVMGLIATIAALVLSLLIASANAGYDQQKSQLRELSANIILLDQTLESFGPEAKPVRDALRDVVWTAHDRIWAPQGSQPESFNSVEMRKMSTENVAKVQNLSTRSDEQRTLKSQAIELQSAIIHTRLLMYEELKSDVPWPLFVVVTFWICTLFLGFGLFARFNPTVTVGLFIGAVSVAGALFLILELTDPYSGIMRISDAPLRNVMAMIDRETLAESRKR